MILSNTIFTLNDAEGILPPQSSNFNVAIGEKRELVIEYEFDSSTNGASFWWVPALFLSTDIPYNQTGTKPNTYYFFEIDPTTVDDTYQDASIVAIQQTQENLSFEWKVSADRLTVTIKLLFYVTADIRDWIRNIELDNLDRFLKNSIENPLQDSNDGQSVYSSSKKLGSYLYTEYPFQEDIVCTYLSDGITATITRTDGGSFIVDGIKTTVSGDVSCTIRSSSAFINLVEAGNITSVTNQTVTFGSITSSFTGSGSGNFFIVTQDSNISRKGSETQTEGISSAGYNRFATFDGRFFSNGLVSNPSYLLERGADQEIDLSSEATTELTLTFDSLTEPTNAITRLLRVDPSSIGNNGTFDQDYELEDITGSTPVLVSGSTYQSVFTIPAVKIEGQYRLLTIVYDSVNNDSGSLLSDLLEVTTLPSNLAIPEIETFVTNYAQRITTASAINAGVFERVRLEIEIDKASYNASNIQGGSFDANFNYIKITRGNDSSTISSEGATWPPSGILSAVNTASKLNIFADVRMKREWIGTEQEWLWEIGLDTEPTQIRLRQRVSVGDIDLLDVFDLANADTSVVITDFYLYALSQIKAVATFADGNLTTSNVAGLLVDGSIQEEDFQDGELPTLSSADISSLTQLVSGESSFLLNFPALSESGTIGLLAFADYQLLLTTDKPNIEIRFEGDPSLIVTMLFEDATVNVPINTWFNYSFPSSGLRTLLFSLGDTALLTGLRISRSDQTGDQFLGSLNTSKLNALTLIEAQNNRLDSFLSSAGSVQQDNITYELANNNLDVNQVLTNIDESNQGAVNANRIVSLHTNLNVNDETISIVNSLEAVGFDIEIAYFKLSS